MLAWITPQETPSQKILLKYINLFLESTIFYSTMAHFVDRCVDPSWFRNRFPGVSPSTIVTSNFVWEAFMTPTLLSTRIEDGTPNYGFVGYQPNLVAIQFGFSQMLPCSLYIHEDDICWSERRFTIADYKACALFYRKQLLELPTFQFQQSFFMTVEYYNWWTQYFNSHFKEDNFWKRLSASFFGLPKNTGPQAIYLLSSNYSYLSFS